MQRALSVNIKNEYSFLYFFSCVLFVTSFIFNTPSEIMAGMIKIFVSPANLITDYFELANVGSTFMNAALMTMMSIVLLQIKNVKLNGAYIAAILTVAGFSLFGKNLYNSIPIILGVYLYAKLLRIDFEKCLQLALFASALGPLVSEITFNLNLPLQFGLPLGISMGVLIGLVLTPLANHVKQIHQGYNLYNVGFTAGLVGTGLISILRKFNLEFQTVNLVSEGNNKQVTILLAILLIVMVLWGIAINNWSMKGYGKLLNNLSISDRDYMEHYGLGITLINMSLVGFIATAYVLLVGGELNGPVLGGVLTVMGFGANGKHPKNIIPIMFGVFIMSWLSSTNYSSTSILLAALFGTTLAPISQTYGPLVGILAGGMHVSLVVNTSYLHGGMNLYNNGFSGGFVAAMLIPLLDAVNTYRKNNLKNHNKVS